MLFAGREIFGFDYDESIVGVDSFYTEDPVTGALTATQKTIHYTMIFNAFVFC